MIAFTFYLLAAAMLAVTLYSTHKQRLEIGQPGVIRPAIAPDCRPMAAVIVRAIDQDAAHADLAHFAERYFLSPQHQSFNRFAISESSPVPARLRP